MMKKLYKTLQPAMDTQSQFQYKNTIPPVLKFPVYNGIDQFVPAKTSVVAKVICLPKGNNYLIYSGISPGLTRFY